jgi:hypothetical protein
MKKKLLILILSLILLTGCTELTQMLQYVLAENVLKESHLPTQADIVSGLKEALSLGVHASVSALSNENAYLNDELLKIALPPEAEIITENLAKIPGGQILIDEVLKGINLAASDAAEEARPILVKSINDMSFTDALGILSGGDNAATNYLKKTNYDELVQLFKPKIQTSLNKEYLSDISPQKTWDELTSKWNKVAGSIVGMLAGLETVETDLSLYLTQHALDGLFLKIGDSEQHIRKEASARVTPLLEKVFSPENIAELMSVSSEQ